MLHNYVIFASRPAGEHNMSDTLYSSYAHIYYSFKKSTAGFTAALDHARGFAPRFRDACQKA